MKKIVRNCARLKGHFLIFNSSFSFFRLRCHLNAPYVHSTLEVSLNTRQNHSDSSFRCFCGYVAINQMPEITSHFLKNFLEFKPTYCVTKNRKSWIWKITLVKKEWLISWTTDRGYSGTGSFRSDTLRNEFFCHINAKENETKYGVGIRGKLRSGVKRQGIPLTVLQYWNVLTVSASFIT